MTRRKNLLFSLSLAAGVLAIGIGDADSASVANPSFETDSFGTFPGYISGAANGPVTGWTHTTDNQQGINPHSGTGDASPFANDGVIPAGSQVGFIQTNSNTNSFTSTAGITGLTPGTVYQVSWRANSRTGKAVPTFESKVNGTTLVGAPINAVGATNPYRYINQNFTAGGTTATFEIQSTTTGDGALLLDDIQITANPAFTQYQWSGDASSGINSALTYTHAYNFNSAANPVINGVAFTGITGGNPTAGNFTLTGSPNTANDAANNVTGSSAALAANFVHGAGTAGQNTLTLTGLTNGQAYRTSIFGMGWDDVNNPWRTSLFQSGSDRLTVSEQIYGVDNGIRIDYDFVAGGTSQVITYDALAAATFHTYGFANAVIPEPSGVALVGLGLLGLLTRRRR